MAAVHSKVVEHNHPVDTRPEIVPCYHHLQVPFQKFDSHFLNEKGGVQRD